jgi:hypothetical protein
MEERHIHNKGPLQRTFHSRPLENVYEISILNILTP